MLDDEIEIEFLGNPDGRQDVIGSMRMGTQRNPAGQRMANGLLLEIPVGKVGPLIPGRFA